MAQIAITNLSRCQGGNHFTAEVTIDGGKPLTIHFDRPEVEQAVAAVPLESAVIRLIASDLKSLWRSESKPTLEAESAIVVGKSAETDVVLSKKQSENSEAVKAGEP